MGNNNCPKLHRFVNTLTRLSIQLDKGLIPDNGIYILFERGEKAHGFDRIVRVGTHTGQNQLYSRLNQHFLNENKDRSIFRKNIGRCFLNKTQDPYLKVWNLDMTTRSSRFKYSKLLNIAKQNEIEKDVTNYLVNNFSFVVIRIDDKSNRIDLESKIISTLSLCLQCSPSKHWLGNYSPIDKIKNSGLWLVNELYKKPLSDKELSKLMACSGQLS